MSSAASLQQSDNLVDGDVFDNDTGEHLGSIDTISSGLPAGIMLFFQGYFYIYKIDSRLTEAEVSREPDAEDTIPESKNSSAGE